MIDGYEDGIRSPVPMGTVQGIAGGMRCKASGGMIDDS